MSTVKKISIVWFRRDLRFADNPALCRAVEGGGRVLPLLLEEAGEGEWAPGLSGAWWRARSARQLKEALRAEGLPLLVLRGDEESVFSQLIDTGQCGSIWWNEGTTPAERAADDRLGLLLEKSGLEGGCSPAYTLCHPSRIRSSSGGPYRVFTPFWRRLRSDFVPGRPLPAPDLNGAGATEREVQKLCRLAGVSPGEVATPSVDLSDWWEPGETSAWTALERFREERLDAYPDDRDRPDLDGTSELSPHLAWGELSARQIWWEIQDWADLGGDLSAAEGFLRQLAWREFGAHLLFHFPSTATEPLRTEFARFPWVEDRDGLRRWKEGRTGLPMVDAGMRQLRETGWMHNRVRMIVASFLTKDLRIHWLEGARWFWDRLVDADLANNTLGWQWAAGCGADAQPYFRVFNPYLQAKRYDPEAAYMCRWVPELAGTDPSELLRERGPGSSGQPGFCGSYPAPMLDHSARREEALEAYAAMKEDTSPSSRRTL